MSYYGSSSYLLGGAALTVPASLTKEPVSKQVRVGGRGATHMVVDVKVSAATVAAGVNLILQDSQDGGTTWNDKKSTAVADAFTGWKTQTYLAEVAGDQTHLPFRGLVRVVATTGAGDSVTISDVIITQGT
jgi:hypothetical protein